ncbi:MAG: fibronectin type III domain-containing protein [Candidatus Cloacimonetes bacterium]|nr:fibronectin type III domain-containing protein [Candidatus Cloacimonadota bacterium]MCF7815043.1 fibronectin type III domain-containing protein [Candidatus Cloacimonadota bacterium]MCF7868369.1 fibronectin type III domain-containing protein [Candidatus Cloacimonadota bacterium]MCF7883865.1 fibronectin type III domain-containing protein [Candidatus Cloacimonadota bacterium]
MKIVGKLIPFALIILLFIVISCTDSLDKTTSLDDVVRVEYSDCTACYECIDLFDCPEGAIKIDSTHFTQRVYIDTDLCVQCMECTNIFQCPENAFNYQPDLVPPAAVQELQGYSTQQRNLNIQFIATGDDGEEGDTYAYDFYLTASNGDKISINFDIPNPFISGYWEYWDPIDSLPAGENITVHITAIDEAGNRSPEATTEVEIMETISPAPISDLTINDVTFNEMTLSWTAVGDDGMEGVAGSYIVKVSTEQISNSNWDDIAEYPNQIQPANPGETETFVISGLIDNMNYFTAVKAVDDFQNSSPLSNVAEATTLQFPDLEPPAAVDDLEVENGSINMNSFLLQWTAVGDDGTDGTAESYIVKIYTEIIDENNWDNLPEYPQNITPSAAGTTESLTIEGLDPLTEYFAAVKAVDDAQNIADLSNVVNATTTELPDTEPPDTITDLDSEGTETTIELTWTAPGDDGMIGTAHHYEIRMHDTEIDESNWEDAEILPGPPWPLTAGSLQDYTVSGLEYNQTYFFAVKAFDDNQNVSEVSNSPSATMVNDTTPPADITDLTIYEGYASNLSTIRIQWTAPGDDGDQGTCDHYEIRYATIPIDEGTWDFATVFNDPPDPQSAGTNQFCNVSGLLPATIYYFAIKAYDEMGNENSVSNSPAAKLVYQINTNACHNCAQCIGDCSSNAIHQGAGYKYINPDECTACGDCSCPWNLIFPAVVAY